MAAVGQRHCDAPVQNFESILSRDKTQHVLRLLGRYIAGNVVRWRVEHYYIRKPCRKEEVVAALLDAGADIEATDTYGETPLHFATINFGMSMMANCWMGEYKCNQVAGRTPLPIHKLRCHYILIQ
jgi:hypothetical protein